MDASTEQKDWDKPSQSILDPIEIPQFLQARPAPISVLPEADAVVHGRSAAEYGSPSGGFAKTAALWSAYLGFEISAKDCAAMFALNKFSREKHKHKRDNLVDIAGYAEVMRMIEDGE